ncbi:FMN-binding domain-containing protein [Micromonospora coriariae]|uniref:FMN-binding domain-containing protein n=1 Tax=Micromonospora coriariae TaxID=285665 RepID=A0A1C4WT05_9ACTN|nr:FMN-binding protein [Micromonospora coriariae]SCE99288.1 FMN-binding domain-containing protein [Micromonospora coriariae]
MRRAFLAITGLAASTTALVVLKGSPGTTPVAQDLPAAQPVNPTPQGVDPSAAPAGAAPKPSVTADAPTSPKPSRSTARPSSTRTTAKAPSAQRTTKAPQPSTRRVTGPGVDNEYGYVQVQIVISGNRIVEAISLSLPSGGESDIHSGDVRDRYNGTGGEVVRKQSANLDTVSGATETSNSYKQSLRGAIEQAF